MENIIPVASELGYLHVDESSLITVDQINKYPENQVLIITTGSQGEPMTALSRMAAGLHRKVQIKTGDTVVFSSSPIPGNEKSVFNTINQL